MSEEGKSRLLGFAVFGSLMAISLFLLVGCSGPTDADMAGCTTSNRAPTHREVADCAIQREEYRRER